MPIPTTTPLPEPELDRHTGIYPGTFDPVTNGHMDIIQRAARILDRLVVGVASNAGKGPIFPIEERHGAGARRDRPDRCPHRHPDRGHELQRPAGGVRPPQWRNRDHTRPARGQRLRLRVPDGGDELPAGPGDRDGVPDGQRDAPVHLISFREGDRPAGRRHLLVRAAVDAGTYPATGTSRRTDPSPREPTHGPPNLSPNNRDRSIDERRRIFLCRCPARAGSAEHRVHGPEGRPRRDPLCAPTSRPSTSNA